MTKTNFYVNEFAVVDDNVIISEGSKIWHFSHIQTVAKIGKKCILGQNVNVGNDVTIDKKVKIQNNVSSICEKIDVSLDCISASGLWIWLFVQSKYTIFRRSFSIYSIYLF